jgi:cytidyltransferase-like protein
MKISVVSGGFDPIHSGHIEYLNSAAQDMDKLIVCLNSDEWLKKKKGNFFLPFNERRIILDNIKVVDEVIDFLDDELGSCINGLKKIQEIYPNDEIYFCNGGDRGKDNIPEMGIKNIKFKFSVGGDNKLNSSSWILKKWQYPHEERIWGQFYNLFQDSNVKVKELIVHPGKGMSFQRHFKRNEIWFISKGKCLINFSKNDPNNAKEIILKKDDTYFINVKDWHQITNPYQQECKIIEIQYGEETTEDDIERLYYYS